MKSVSLTIRTSIAGGETNLLLMVKTIGWGVNSNVIEAIHVEMRTEERLERLEERNAHRALEKDGSHKQINASQFKLGLIMSNSWVSNNFSTNISVQQPGFKIWKTRRGTLIKEAEPGEDFSVPDEDTML